MENLKKRLKSNFQEINVRPNRKQVFEVAPMMLKVRAVCNFEPSVKTVHSMLKMKQVLESSDWVVNIYQSTYLLCYLEESILLAFSAAFGLSRHAKQTKEILLEMVTLLFSRIDDSQHSLTPHLIAILGQLVFVFMFPNGCEHKHYAFFTSLCGVGRPRRPLSNMITGKVKVVNISEVLEFHVEILYMYCNKYDKELKKQMKSLVSACLLLYGEEDVLEYVGSLSW